MEKIKLEDLKVGNKVLLDGFGCTSDEGYELHKFTVSYLEDGRVTLKNPEQIITVDIKLIEEGLMNLYKEERSTTLLDEIMSGLNDMVELEELKKQQDIKQALSSLSLPCGFLETCSMCEDGYTLTVEEEFNFTFTQTEVNVLTSILGFFNPEQGDNIYTLQDKLSEASEEHIVEEMFDKLELVNEDGSSLNMPLFGVEGYFLNNEAMNLKFNK